MFWPTVKSAASVSLLVPQLKSVIGHSSKVSAPTHQLSARIRVIRQLSFLRPMSSSGLYLLLKMCRMPPTSATVFSLPNAPPAAPPAPPPLQSHRSLPLAQACTTTSSHHPCGHRHSGGAPSLWNWKRFGSLPQCVGSGKKCPGGTESRMLDARCNPYVCKKNVNMLNVCYIYILYVC